MTPAQEADLYIALHQGTHGDVRYYERACTGAQRVLELGAGAGRVLLPVSRVSQRCVGIELHVGMLDRARQAQVEQGIDNVKWVAGDVLQARVSGRFDRVLIPFSGLWCLPGRAAQQRCLARAHAWLEDQGQLLLDVYAADGFKPLPLPEEPEVDALEFLVDLTCNQGRYQVFERSTWWPSQQHLRVEYEFRPAGGAARRRIVTEISHHYLFTSELERLVVEAGFRDLRWGIRGLARRPVRADQVFLQATRA